ncbi:zonular occludens toxin domain-containing protein [Psychrobacillus sp. FSL H8-0487]|uniref:zonular occludens toxin domain-containing protein n=1 Tax=Psychrobacillus sp. FSL H8-0487 TaxID=2921391 RepID=UPI0030F8B040
MIETYLGTIGSGKSYHALEKIIETLGKGKYVVANFPLNFTQAMIRKGYADKFMYVPDDFLMDIDGVAFLFQLQKKEDFYKLYGEGGCLVVIDEVGNYFPPEDNGKYSTKLWKTFFTQSRKMGYDFLLICQDDLSQVNKTIRKCVEYRVEHRKANHVFPFKLLPFTLFMYVTYWGKKNQRLNSSSSIYVKRFGSLYNTEMMFGGIEETFDLDLDKLKAELGFSLEFGNCHVEELDHDEGNEIAV